MSELLISSGWDDIKYDLAEEIQGRPLLPEEKLLLAIIIQAVDDATNPHVPDPIRNSARSVIFSVSATELKGMCHLLDIEYSSFRARVEGMIQRGETLRR